MIQRLLYLAFAALLSSSSLAFTDSLWIVGNGGYPGDLVSVEVWLQYGGSGPGDSMAGFDIPLTWDAAVCTVEAITIGTDFIDCIGLDWRDRSRIDNAGTLGPPAISKIGITAYTLWTNYVAHGTHLAATVDFRILENAAPGDSTYIDTLMKAFSPPVYLSYMDMDGMDCYVPTYGGGWITVTALSGDVKPQSIISPPPVVIAGSTYSPSAVIRNFGPDSLGPIPVICTIDSWADTVEISGIDGFTAITVDFDGWTVSQSGSYTIYVVTQYVGDAHPANDTLRTDIRAYLLGDVGPVTITGPPDTVYVGRTYTPSVTVMNSGANPAGPIPVTCTIDAWEDSLHIETIPPDDVTTVDFAQWSVLNPGLHSVTFSTHCPGDTNASNDVQSKTVYAAFPDVTPSDSLWVMGGHAKPGELVPVEVWLQYEGRGPGDSMSSFDIPLTWDATVCTVEALTMGPDFVEVAWVNASQLDNQGIVDVPLVPKIAISFFWFKTFESAARMIPRGIHLVATLDFRVLDAAMAGNHAYVDTLMKAFLPPLMLHYDDKRGMSAYVPTYGGGSVVVLAEGRDVGPTSIVSPPPVVAAGSSYSPSAVIRNFGSDWLGPISVICTIDPWTDTIRITNLAGLDSAAAVFAEWTVPDTGLHLVTVVTQSHYDPNPLNDTLSKVVHGQVGVDELPDRLTPSVYCLSQCYPNPTSAGAAISYQIASTCHVRLRIFDSAGRLVKTLVDEEKEAAYHSVKWNGRDDSGQQLTSTGVYFYRLEAGDFTSTRKMIVLR